MAADIEGLLTEAMKLSPDQRGSLAARLLESLEEGEHLSPSEWERVWAPEFNRRAREMEEHAVEVVPWADLERELEADD